MSDPFLSTNNSYSTVEILFAGGPALSERSDSVIANESAGDVT